MKDLVVTMNWIRLKKSCFSQQQKN